MNPQRRINNSPHPHSLNTGRETEGRSLPTSGVSRTIDLRTLDVAIKNYEEKFETLQDKIEETKRTNIGTLAIFVALFTFVSIEFQLAKNFDFSQFLFFSPLFAGLLVLFVLALHITLYEEINWRVTIFIFSLILVFFAGGFLSRILLIKDATILSSPKNTCVERINIDQAEIDP